MEELLSEDEENLIEEDDGGMYSVHVRVGHVNSLLNS